MAEARLQVIAGEAAPQEPLATDPWQFQIAYVDAFVASWRARGFSPVAGADGYGLTEVPGGTSNLIPGPPGRCSTVGQAYLLCVRIPEHRR